MKKHIRKITSVSLATLLIITVLSGTAMAAGVENLHEEESSATIETINEYDAILESRRITRSRASYSDAEKYYLERANLSETELQGMGYTTEQIKILKAYDGTPLEDNPQLQDASPTLTASLSRQAITTNYIKVKYTWSWNACPIATFTDIVGFSWAAVNPQNGGVSLAFASKDGSMEVTYQYTASSITAKESVTMSAGTGSGATAYNSAQGRFSVVKYNTAGGIQSYAKSGTATVTLRLPNASANNLYEANVAAKYGHTTVALTPSVTIAGSLDIAGLLSMFSFSPTVGVSELGVYSYRYGVDMSIVRVYP